MGQVGGVETDSSRRLPGAGAAWGGPSSQAPSLQASRDDSDSTTCSLVGPLPRRSSLTAWLRWFCLSAHRYLLLSAPMCIMSSLWTGEGTYWPPPQAQKQTGSHNLQPQPGKRGRHSPVAERDPGNLTPWDKAQLLPQHLCGVWWGPENGRKPSGEVS